MRLNNEDVIYKRNIGLLALLYIPIVLLSKLVRWTIMKPQLVDAGIGWKFVDKINSGTLVPFAFNSNNSLQFYDFVNVCGLESYVEWEWFVTIALNIAVFLVAIRFYRKNRNATLTDSAFIYLNVAILNIFCFCMAKEPAQMICFLLMSFAIIYPPNRTAKRVSIVLALLFTAFFLRKYYGMVLIYYLIVEFAITNWISKIDTTTTKGKFYTIFAVLGLLLFFAGCQYVLLSVMSSVDPVTYTEMIRVNNREGSSAASEIAPIFRSENRVLFTVDYFIKIFRLMFPVELLLKGKVTYLFIVVYHFMLFKYLLKNFFRFNDLDHIQKCALFLYVAFWMCSASFEPDFGSWIRHEGVSFPIIILLLSKIRNNSLYEQKS